MSESAEELGAKPEIPAPDGLDALAREAAKFDTEQAGNLPENTEPPTPEVDPVSNAQEWKAAVQFGCGIVIQFRQELAEEWTVDRLDALAEALAKCGHHYGWNIQKLLGHPLLALAAAAFPMVMGLVRIEKARAEKKAAPQPQPS